MKVLLTITSILILGGGLLLGIYGHNAAMTFAFLASVFFLFMANLDRISEFRASPKGVEARTREVITKAESAITELRLLAKNIVSLNLSLVKRSGWLGGYTDDEQESIRETLLDMLGKVGIPEAEMPDVQTGWHSLTEYEYAQAILGGNAVPQGVEPEVIKEWNLLRSGGLSKIPTPSEIRRSRSISSTSRCSMFDCLTRAMTASISAGLVFGISSPLPILDRSPSHSRGNNYFDRPLPQSAFDWEDFSADVRLFLKGTPPHRRDTFFV